MILLLLNSVELVMLLGMHLRYAYVVSMLNHLALYSVRCTATVTTAITVADCHKCDAAIVTTNNVASHSIRCCLAVVLQL
jgi:hypothetical protein